MPNWCSNSIHIHGSKEEVAAIWSIMTDTSDESGDEVQPMRLLPMPEALVGTRSPQPTEARLSRYVELLAEAKIDTKRFTELVDEYAVHVIACHKAMDATGYADWYSWAVENWGTKWTMSVHAWGGDPDDGHFYVQGDTAWGPPLQLLIKASTQFPEVVFRISYSEEGMGFAGYTAVRNGNCVSSEGDLVAPDGLDWDDDDAHEIWTEAIWDQLKEHEETVESQIGEL